LKAVANVTGTEIESIVDKLLFEGLLDKLVSLAKEYPKQDDISEEMCFALSNIACGSPGHLQVLLEH